jgi:hypothetical protein
MHEAIVGHVVLAALVFVATQTSGRIPGPWQAFAVVFSVCYSLVVRANTRNSPVLALAAYVMALLNAVVLITYAGKDMTFEEQRRDVVTKVWIVGAAFAVLAFILQTLAGGDDILEMLSFSMMTSLLAILISNAYLSKRAVEYYETSQHIHNLSSKMARHFTTTPNNGERIWWTFPTARPHPNEPGSPTFVANAQQARTLIHQLGEDGVVKWTGVLNAISVPVKDHTRVRTFVEEWSTYNDNENNKYAPLFEAIEGLGPRLSSMTRA